MKRYIIATDDPNIEMVENPNGRWVWYGEAQERIDELEALLKKSLALHKESKVILQRWEDYANE